MSKDPDASSLEEQLEVFDFPHLVGELHDSWQALLEPFDDVRQLCAVVLNLASVLPQYLNSEKVDDELVDRLESLRLQVRCVVLSLQVAAACNKRISDTFDQMESGMRAARQLQTLERYWEGMN